MTNVKNGADNNKKVYEETTIFRRDGKNCFFDMMHSAYTIGKQHYIFANYDPQKGNKQTTNINIYLDMEEQLVLNQEILSGKLHTLAQKSKKIAAEEKEKTGKEAYPKPVYESLGGVTLERFKKQGKKYSFDVPEGFCISRILRLTPGMKADWMFSAQVGLGKEDKNGLIVPQGMPKEIVRIPMSNKDLKKLALIGDAHIKGYISAQHKPKSDIQLSDAQLQAMVFSVVTMLKSSMNDDVMQAVKNALIEQAPQQTTIQQ